MTATVYILPKYNGKKRIICLAWSNQRQGTTKVWDNSSSLLHSCECNHGAATLLFNYESWANTFGANCKILLTFTWYELRPISSNILYSAVSKVAVVLDSASCTLYVRHCPYTYWAYVPHVPRDVCTTIRMGQWGRWSKGAPEAQVCNSHIVHLNLLSRYSRKVLSLVLEWQCFTFLLISCFAWYYRWPMGQLCLSRACRQHTIHYPWYCPLSTLSREREKIRDNMLFAVFLCFSLSASCVAALCSFISYDLRVPTEIRIFVNLCVCLPPKLQARLCAPKAPMLDKKW